MAQQSGDISTFRHFPTLKLSNLWIPIIPASEKMVSVTFIGIHIHVHIATQTHTHTNT